MYSHNKSGKKHLPPLQSARVLDQLRERIRYMHYSLRTEEAYVYWAKAFIRFHELRHPAEMGKAEVEAFLMWLVAKRNAGSETISTQRPIPALKNSFTQPAPAALPNPEIQEQRDDI